MDYFQFITTRVLLVIPVANNNIVPTKLVAEIREHGDITKNKSDRPRNEGSQIMKPPGYPNLCEREKEGKW